MQRLRSAGYLVVLPFTLVLPAPGQQPFKAPQPTTLPPPKAAASQVKPEPAGVKGYITWTDPASGRKHLITGMAHQGASGPWNIPVIADLGPILEVVFTAITGGNQVVVTINYSGDAYTLDQAGNRLPYIGLQAEGYRWLPPQVPAAFRYDIRFLHDLGYMIQPVVQTTSVQGGLGGALPPESNYVRTIRYNPTLYRFSDLRLKDNGTLTQAQIQVNPTDFLDSPPIQKRRPSPFTDLPAF